MSLVQDRSLDLLTNSPACYYCATYSVWSLHNLFRHLYILFIIYIFCLLSTNYNYHLHIYNVYHSHILFMVYILDYHLYFLFIIYIFLIVNKSFTITCKDTRVKKLNFALMKSINIIGKSVFLWYTILVCESFFVNTFIILLARRRAHGQSTLAINGLLNAIWSLQKDLEINGFRTSISA